MAAFYFGSTATASQKGAQLKVTMNSPAFSRVTVIGCGLIGASFALALKRLEPRSVVAGWDSSPEVIRAALQQGVIEKVDDAFVCGGISESDLIYLAMPVSAIIEFLKTRGAQIRPSALITDAGSTKEEICRVAREYLPPDRIFIGGHPIAGSEHAGLSHARANLFTGAAYVLIDEGKQLEEPRSRLQQILLPMGVHLTLMTAAEHDRVFAKVSHLPQLLSSTLAATIEEETNSSEMLEVAGSGLRDMTRLARSSWSMWSDILATNPTFIKSAVDDFMIRLEAIRTELEKCSDDNPNELIAAHQLFADAERFAAVMSVQTTKRNGR